MFVNMYPEELLLRINGPDYRVAGGTTLPLEGQPAGMFTYEVLSPTLGIRANKTTSLGANETFTITAR